MLNPAFQKAKHIVEKLINNGYDAYFVGGAVRDELLGLPVKDIDIATSATPDDVMNLFAKTIPVGAEHGTVIIRHDGESYEVTTFRAESAYKDYRHPDKVSFITSLHQDLERRDFTINAMALTVDGDLIDPFSGEKDLKSNRLRAVGNPAERFQEDPLRMMRALRFMSTYGFDLEPATAQALKRYGAYLEQISVERLRSEFEKLLAGTHAGEAIQYLITTGLHPFLPGLSYKHDRLSRLSRLNLSHLTQTREHWALACLILKPEELHGFLRKWKLSNKMILMVKSIVEIYPKVDQAGWQDENLYLLGIELSQSVERIRSLLNDEDIKLNLGALTEQYKQLPIKNKKDLSVNGSDLLAWAGKPPGPWVGEMVAEIESAVINHSVKNEKGAIKLWLQEKMNLQ